MKKTNPIKEFQLTQLKNLKELASRMSDIFVPKESTDSSYLEVLPKDAVLELAQRLDIDPSELVANPDEVTQVIVPIVNEVIDGEFVSHASAKLSISSHADQTLFFYIAEDEAMEPEIKEGSLILAKDKTTITDGSLVVILPDDSTKPLVRRVQYTEETIQLLAKKFAGRSYTTDNAVILGDVIAITWDADNYWKHKQEAEEHRSKE